MLGWESDPPKSRVLRSNRFNLLRSIVSKDGEIGDGIPHGVQVECFGSFVHCKIHTTLKGKFYLVL